VPLVHRALRDPPDNQETLEAPDNQETLAHRGPRRNLVPQSAFLANDAPLDPWDNQETKDPQDSLVRPETPEDRDKEAGRVYPDLQDHREIPDSQDNPVDPDNQEIPEPPVPVHPVFQAPRDPQDSLDSQETQDNPEAPDNQVDRDPQDHRELQGSLDNPETPEDQDNLVDPDSPDTTLPTVPALHAVPRQVQLWELQSARSRCRRLNLDIGKNEKFHEKENENKITSFYFSFVSATHKFFPLFFQLCFLEKTKKSSK